MSDTKLAGLNYYVTSNVDSADDKTKAVILCCDIFGLAGRVPNAKLLADAFSEKTGFVFYIPDLLEGDYASPEALEGLMIEVGLDQREKQGKDTDNISQYTIGTDCPPVLL